MQATVAREMARNNRYEVMARLRDLGASIMTETAIETVSDGHFVVRTRGEEARIPIGDVVIVAIGPEPQREVVDEVEAAGAPYVLAGDCNQPRRLHGGGPGRLDGGARDREQAGEAERHIGGRRVTSNEKDQVATQGENT